jgi:hypothetical protein
LWGTVEIFVLDLRLETETLINEKSKVVAELSDENWLGDLALLCDINRQLNKLNIKFQSKWKQILICLWLS